MKKSIIKRSVLTSVIIAISLTAIIDLSARSNKLNDDGEKIELMSNKLAKKLLLNDDQTAKVIAILGEYFTKAAAVNDDNSKIELLRKTASKKITELLDTKQKMKFEIIEADWWKEAN